MEQKRRKARTKNDRKRISESVKWEVVKQSLLGGVSQTCLAERFGIGQQTVSQILRTFAASNDKSMLLMKNKPVDNKSEEIKALQKEVLDLKKKLYDETMRADFFETMVDVAEDMFDIDIRKKAVTGQSKGCTAKKDMQ